MKKIFTTTVAAVAAMSLFLASCGDVSTDSETESKVAYSSDSRFAEYAEIGTSVYAALEKEYGGSEGARAVLNGISDDEEDFASADLLVSNGYVSERAAAYIARIDRVIDESEDTSELLSRVSAIELEAMQNLEGEEQVSVMAYAESAKATVAYFDNADDDTLSRSAWSRFKKRAKRVAKKTGIGAAIGAVSGAIGGASGGPLGIVLGAVNGAVDGAVAGFTKGVYDEFKDWLDAK